MKWIAAIAFIALIVVAHAADTTPPTITNFTALKSVITDYPVRVQFKFVYNGPYYDPASGNVWPKALYMQWPIHSNWVYTIWDGPTVLGPWTEWGISTNVHPARMNGTAITYVPLFAGQNHFYQIRADNSVGDIYP